MTEPKKQDKGHKFLGGEGLTGLLKIYHETMMGNELSGGYGAYKISYAGGEKSGFSFGGNQMDMSEDPDKIEIFTRILESAKNKEGNAFFTHDEVTALAGKKDSNLMKKGTSPQKVFGATLPRINAALSSDYGRQVIDQVYPIEMEKKAREIEEKIQNIKNPAAKEFYESTLGKILLFDYNNQFQLNAKGSLLQDYIDGEFNKTKREHFVTGEKFTAPTDKYTIEDHKRFIFSTKEYTQTKENCDNRLAHSQKIANKFSSELEADAQAKTAEAENILENNEEKPEQEENVDEYIREELRCETRIETRMVEVETLEDRMYRDHPFFGSNPFGQGKPQLIEEKYEVTECKMVPVKVDISQVGDAIKYGDIFGDETPIFHEPAQTPAENQDPYQNFIEELQCETRVETRRVKIETLEDIMYRDHPFFNSNPFGQGKPQYRDEPYEVTECKVVLVENRDVLRLGEAKKEGPPLKYEDIFSDESSLFGEPMQTAAVTPPHSSETAEHAVVFPATDLTSSTENLLHPLHPEI